MLPGGQHHCVRMCRAGGGGRGITGQVSVQARIPHIHASTESSASTQGQHDFDFHESCCNSTSVEGSLLQKTLIHIACMYNTNEMLSTGVRSWGHPTWTRSRLGAKQALCGYDASRMLFRTGAHLALFWSFLDFRAAFKIPTRLAGVEREQRCGAAPVGVPDSIL